MLRVSFVCILVMVVLLSASLCQAATITGLASSYSVNENFEGTIASFTVDPADAQVTFSGTGLTHTERSGTPGTYDIAFSSPHDFEANANSNSISIVVSIPDASASATVTVLDVDEPPQFGALPSVSSIREDATSATVDAGTYTATDPESVDISWYIRGTDSSFFSISTEGALTFTYTALDYEKKSSYSVTIVASDGTNEATRSVTVTITNVDEPGTVALNPMSGLRVGGTVTATLTDPDSNTIPNVNWVWDGDGVDTTSASYTAVEDDAGDTLSVTATYFDGVGSGTKTATESVGTVLPESNRPPEITGTPSAAVDYAENGTEPVLQRTVQPTRIREIR